MHDTQWMATRLAKIGTVTALYRDRQVPLLHGAGRRAGVGSLQRGGVVPGASGIAAYVGHPLHGIHGAVLGLLAIEHTVKLEYCAEIAQLLRDLSGHVAAELECLAYLDATKPAASAGVSR